MNALQIRSHPCLTTPSWKKVFTILELKRKSGVDRRKAFKWVQQTNFSSCSISKTVISNRVPMKWPPPEPMCCSGCARHPATVLLNWCISTRFLAPPITRAQWLVYSRGSPPTVCNLDEMKLMRLIRCPMPLGGITRKSKSHSHYLKTSRISLDGSTTNISLGDTCNVAFDLTNYCNFKGCKVSNNKQTVTKRRIF